METPRDTIEHLLQQPDWPIQFLTPEERRGGWRRLFGAAADAVPQPYRLFGEDEASTVALGFPRRESPGWAAVRRDIARLVEAEAAYRTAVTAGEAISKTSLLEQRSSLGRRLADMIEGALGHGHGQRLPQVLWLALSREMAEACTAVTATVAARVGLATRAAEDLRWGVAQRLADLGHRAEIEAISAIEGWHSGPSLAPAVAFGRLLREDLLPIAETRIARDFRQIDGFMQAVMHVEPARVHAMLATAAEQVDVLRARDPSFERVLAMVDADSQALPSDRLLLCDRVLELLGVWAHPQTPRLPPDLLSLLRELGARLKRFEVLALLRERVLPVTSADDGRIEISVQRQAVRLSSFTRPLDFTTPGVVDSTVRRFGLVYDLVEFTQILEALRHRGRVAEEGALRQMVRFQNEVEQIRARHRLMFEKFLGDGAFYSARSARATLLAAGELRLLYEQLRRQGFPFDRGMRLALSVGSYHLLPMAVGDRAHYEFFGHGLVELARLTSGKTTHEVEDIADFLIASGYDVHRVLEFLEPVRHASRYPDHFRERPYAAFLAENRELVNLGGVVTEAFLTALEAEQVGDLALGERWGLRWLLLPLDSAAKSGPWLGLRFLGTARLKGLGPIPIAETVVFESPLEGSKPLPPGSPFVRTLEAIAGEGGAEASVEEQQVDATLTVVSTGAGGDRAWYIGHYDQKGDMLLQAFCVRLTPVDLTEGEPFESWLFRRRGELGMLYQGLRRGSPGSDVALASLRSREGYFTCLLSAPHRSPV